MNGSHVRALNGGSRWSLARRPCRPSSKHPLFVDRHETTLAVTLTSGNRHDVTQLMPLLEAIPSSRGLRGRPHRKPRHLYADRGCDFGKCRRLLWQRGIKPLIGRRGATHGSGLGKVRWVVDRRRGRLTDYEPQRADSVTQFVDREAGSALISVRDPGKQRRDAPGGEPSGIAQFPPLDAGDTFQETSHGLAPFMGVAPACQRSPNGQPAPVAPSIQW